MAGCDARFALGTWARGACLALLAGWAGTSLAGSAPVPLLAAGQPVDWWFAFKFNTQSFPGCARNAAPSCPYGGTAQDYPSSQQYAVASSNGANLASGTGCLGDGTLDPVGATYGEIWNGNYYFVVWNDQFYGEPAISGCGNSCSGPWGHSKGLVAWNDAGEGLVLQVSTPSWPASGSKAHPRTDDGNTLGCVKDNDVLVSQHFFALRLTKDDLVAVLQALGNASVVTDPQDAQIVHNGGPADVQQLVSALGRKSPSRQVLRLGLSTGVGLISKPSALHVPPWQLVSAELGGVDLRVATWWAAPYIYSTAESTSVSCWDTSLGMPGAVEIATSGAWQGSAIGLKGGSGPSFNHAKVGVSTTGDHPFVIFGDMNQQGALDGDNCARSQNGRGGLFYVLENAALAGDVGRLLQGDSAPLAGAGK